MSAMVSRLKEGAYQTRELMRTDNKKIDSIDRIATKQNTQIQIEVHALRRYYRDAGTRTCKEYLIVIGILVVFVMMAVYIILD